MAEVAVLRSDKELLLKEKSTLEERLKSTPATSAQTSRPADLDRIKNLETERSELQQQLARSQKDLAAAQKGSGSRKVESSSKELAQARKQVETLQAEKDTLRLEKLALEGRLKQTMGSEGAATPAFAAQSSGDLKRVEAERDDLKRRLAAAEKELASRKGKAKPSKDSVKMEREIAELRARVAVLEAKPVPYSAEELALFRKAEPTLPAAASQPPASSTAANATLTTEAQKHFARNEFKEAESKLQKAVQQESTNATALAELAVTQIRQNNLDQAEKNAADAVTAAPDNAFAQQVMGHVKYRQGKYDEALNYMSRAAQLDPQNAETQNFLGVILSKKGMRGPAEAALRKAIQLQPNHGEAHNNLAVIYASQTPPLVELARWHYQKALAAGQPRNSELEKLLEKRASN